MLNAIELNNIWSDKIRIERPTKNEPTVKPKIIKVLATGAKCMNEIIKLIPEVKPNYLRTTVYNMCGTNGYKKVLNQGVTGKFYILPTKAKLNTRARVMDILAKGPALAADICDELDDIKRVTVLNMINKLTGKGGYQPKIEHLGDGYYGIILKKFRHGDL